MKALTIALSLFALTTAAQAADIYEGKDIYNTPATLADLLHERTDLNSFTNGNSVAIKIQGGQIAGLQEDQVRQDQQFAADQARQDAAQRAADVRITNNSSSITQLGSRADDQDLAILAERQTNQQQTVRLDGHDQRFAQQDQVNEALSTSLAGMYTDMSGLRGEVRQARREAKQARAGAAAALAVAGHQFDVHGGFQTAISAATMGGYQALAIGAGGAINDRVFINAGLTTSSNQTGAVLSGTYSW